MEEAIAPALEKYRAGKGLQEVAADAARLAAMAPEGRAEALRLELRASAAGSLTLQTARLRRKTRAEALRFRLELRESVPPAFFLVHAANSLCARWKRARTRSASSCTPACPLLGVFAL